MINRILAELTLLNKIIFMKFPQLQKINSLNHKNTEINQIDVSCSLEQSINLFVESKQTSPREIYQLKHFFKNKYPSTPKSGNIRSNQTNTPPYQSKFQQKIKQLDLKLHRLKETKSSPHIRLNREEKLAMHLNPQLHKFSIDHKLTLKKPQIKYVNTMKKIKETSKMFGCSIRAKSQGIQLQLVMDKQKKDKDKLMFTYGKQFDRILRKKLVKGYQSCNEKRKNMNCSLQKNIQEMKNSLKINENSQCYKNFDEKRLQRFLKEKSNRKSQFPFHIKKQIEDKLNKINISHQLKLEATRNDVQFEQIQRSSQSMSSQQMLTLYRKMSQQDSSPTFSRTKESTLLRWTQYEEDISQFMQICQFYKKIQHQLLRYLPNNHLANKINTVIDQVQNGQAIKKIYDKCNYDIKYLNRSRIVQQLKKYKGLLSTMNYIVNIIKLNVSAERKKRFINTEKNVQNFFKLIQNKKRTVSDQLKIIGNSQLKNNLYQSLKKTNVQCLSLNQSYIQFAKMGENQQFSQVNTAKNRTVICQILKYQALMK